MKSGVLFSGGKDSSLALYYALKESHVTCLISVISENKESYMFHTPNIHLVKQQAEAINLPLLLTATKGEKEEELKDLKQAIKQAINQYKIEALYTGAIASQYQSSRISNICKELKIKCINPLWHKPEIELLEELLRLNFEVIIIGVFAEGMENLIAKKLDKSLINELKILKERHKIHVMGEGGEYESFVLNAPYFKHRLTIKKSHILDNKDNSKLLIIDELAMEKS